MEWTREQRGLEAWELVAIERGSNLQGHTKIDGLGLPIEISLAPFATEAFTDFYMLQRTEVLPNT